MSLTVERLKELWAKEFLPNIRKEIRKEIDSLKASLLDLKKRFDESSNTGYLVTQPIRIAYFQHVIALDQSEGWI